MKKVISLDNCCAGLIETEVFIGFESNGDAFFAWDEPYIFKSEIELADALLRIQKWLDRENEDEEFFNLRAVDYSEYLKILR